MIAVARPAASITVSPGVVPNRGMITVVMMLSTIMQALDTTIVNVALPHMEGSLGATQDQISWVLTSYIVAAAILTPATGWLSGRIGRKRLLIISLTGFTATSVLCGLAGSIGQMVLFRILQGLFGATMLPLSQTILLDSYPRNEIGRAMSIWGMGAMVAPILGPTLGGYLTEQYDWRWCFYINLPVGILTILGAFVFIPETVKDLSRKFDWLGFAFFTLAIGATQMALDRGEHLSWFDSIEIQIEAVLALAGFYMFIVHSLTTPRPFIDFSLFRDRNFVLAVTLMMTIAIVLNGSLVLTPQLLQTELAYPVVTSGIVMGPRGFGTIAAMFLFGRLANRIDPRLFLLTGLSMLGGTMYLMSDWSLSVGAAEIIWVGVVQGVGMGFVFGPMTSVAFSTLPGRFRADGSGFYALTRNLGGAVGISIVVSRLTELTQTNHAQLGEFISPFRHLPGFDLPTGGAGLRMLDLEVTHQAGMVAYVNVFRLLAVVSVAFIPLLLLIQRKGAPAAPESMEAAAH